jgi:hypothetical protein
MLEDLKPPVAAANCKVRAVADNLSATDKEILELAVMDKERWPIKSLSRALSDKGIIISETPLSSHRAQSCACFRN